MDHPLLKGLQADEDLDLNKIENEFNSIVSIQKKFDNHDFTWVPTYAIVQF